MEVLMVAGLLGLLLGAVAFIGGLIDDDKDSAILGFTGIVLVIMFIIIPVVNYITNWSFTPYQFNEKNVNKHYIFDNKIYKIILDTTETNKFIEQTYKIKEAK